MPSHSLQHYIESYLAPHPTQQVRELLLSKAILDFAAHSVMLFEPLYLLSVGFSVPQVVLFYAALYVLYYVFLPLGARVSRRNGNERAILLSSPFLFFWYLSLFAIQFHPVFIGVALFCIVTQKVLYWPAYHADLAAWGGRSERGREVSGFTAISAAMATLGPVAGGLVIAAAGYGTLLICAAILILLSNVPLLKTPEFFVPRDFAWAPALTRPFRRANLRGTFAFMGHGEDIVAFTAWPIFISLVIPDVASLGAIVSIAMLVNVGVVLYAGRVSDLGDRFGLLRSGALFTAAAWFVRPIVAGGLGVFLMDSYYRTSKSVFMVPLSAARYDLSDGADAMEQVVSFEMALAAGKAVAGLAAAALLWFFPGNWFPVFMLAAAFSLLYGLMPRPSAVPRAVSTAGGIDPAV